MLGGNRRVARNDGCLLARRLIEASPSLGDVLKKRDWLDFDQTIGVIPLAPVGKTSAAIIERIAKENEDNTIGRQSNE
jgi:hypothetical protein